MFPLFFFLGICSPRQWSYFSFLSAIPNAYIFQTSELASCLMSLCNFSRIASKPHLTEQWHEESLQLSSISIYFTCEKRHIGFYVIFNWLISVKHVKQISEWQLSLWPGTAKNFSSTKKHTRPDNLLHFSGGNLRASSKFQQGTIVPFDWIRVKTVTICHYSKPIGSMVLLSMVTWIPSIYPKC